MLDALYGFDAEIRATVDSTAHETAHARLQWWRGEIDRLVAGRPSHPIAVALEPLRTRRDVDLASLHESLVAADLDLARLTYRSWEELRGVLLPCIGVAAGAGRCRTRRRAPGHCGRTRVRAPARQRAAPGRDDSRLPARSEARAPLPSARGHRGRGIRSVRVAAGAAAGVRQPAPWRLARARRSLAGIAAGPAATEERSAPRSVRDWCWPPCTSGC